MTSDVPEPELTRLEPKTLTRLGRTLDRARRFRAAEERVGTELARLQDEFWLVERYVLVGGRRIPFVVAGATGVFAICASDGAWTLHDLHALSVAADHIGLRLSRYDGRVNAAVCLAFDATEPREWFEPHAQGVWVMGLDWLQRWLFSFGPDHGLRNGDVRRLRQASGPFWERRSTARLPETRNTG